MQFIMGQDTLMKKKKKNIQSPHTFTSPISKQHYDSPDLEVQTCKAWHGPDRNELSFLRTSNDNSRLCMICHKR